MEIHFLSTAVLKKHQLSVRRTRLSSHKRWVSHIDTQMLRGRMALPVPEVGIHMNYMMDKGTKSWSVLGQLKGCLSTDHVPHPLTYSGYTAIIIPSLKMLPVPECMRKPLSPDELEWLAEIQEGHILESSVTVEFTHQILDLAFGRSSDQDFITTFSEPTIPSNYYPDNNGVIRLPRIFNREYRVRVYLSCQFEVKVDQMTIMMIHLRSGFIPVVNFEAKYILISLMMICDKDNYLEFLEYPRRGFLGRKTSFTPSEALILLSEVVEYFSSLETFERNSIFKRMGETQLNSGPSLVPSLRMLLQLKHDHLTALRDTVLQPLEALLQTSVHLGHEKVGQMRQSVELLHRMSLALEDPDIDVGMLKSLIESSITDYYSPYKSWWSSFLSELPAEVCTELYRRLSTGSPGNGPTKYLRYLSLSKFSWFNWSYLILQLNRWVQFKRGCHQVNHSSNSSEQDQVYLGATGTRDLSDLFIPIYRYCHSPLFGSTSSSFYNKNKLITRDSLVIGKECVFADIEEPSDVERCSLLKHGYQFSIKLSGRSLQWQAMPLHKCNLHSVHGRDSGSFYKFGCFFRGYSLQSGSSVDCGRNYMVLLLETQETKVTLCSIRLHDHPKYAFTRLADLISPSELRLIERDKLHYRQYIQDPTRVFPLAFFERQQLVLFAQLSLDTLDSGQVDVGIRLYAFRHNAADQSFTFLRSDRIASHTAQMEDFVPRPYSVGWDSRRSIASRFWYRWSELHHVKVGLWMGDCDGYSLFAWHKGRFVRLGGRRVPAVQWDESMMLAGCGLGPEQPAIGVSRVMAVAAGRLNLECWLFHLRL